jgi:hypothetical protein
MGLSFLCYGMHTHTHHGSNPPPPIPRPTPPRSDDDESTYADALSPRSSASASPVNLDALLAAGHSVGSSGGSLGGGVRRSPDPLGSSAQLNDAGFQTASVRFCVCGGGGGGGVKGGKGFTLRPRERGDGDRQTHTPL